MLPAAMPDLVLREGAVPAARVAERSGKHGLLMLAGSALVAELPEGVREGERPKLAVQETVGRPGGAACPRPSSKSCPRAWPRCPCRMAGRRSCR